MQPQTEPSPLVVLVLRPYVINPRCPKTPLLETASAAFNNLLGFYDVQETANKFSEQLSEKIRITFRQSLTVGHVYHVMLEVTSGYFLHHIGEIVHEFPGLCHGLIPRCAFAGESTEDPISSAVFEG